MYMLTTMTTRQLGCLIRDGKVALNNSNIIFGESGDYLDEYFRNSTGTDEYLIGFRSPLSEKVVPAIQALDPRITDDDIVIIEIEVEEKDVTSYALENVMRAASLFQYGFDQSDVIDEMDLAREVDTKNRFDILCIPYIKLGDIGKKIRVTTLHDELTFPIDEITFYKLKGVDYGR